MNSNTQRKGQKYCILYFQDSLELVKVKTGFPNYQENGFSRLNFN